MNTGTSHELAVADAGREKAAAAPPVTPSSKTPPPPSEVSGGVTTTSERAATPEGGSGPKTTLDHALAEALSRGLGAQNAGALLMDGAMEE